MEDEKRALLRKAETLEAEIDSRNFVEGNKQKKGSNAAGSRICADESKGGRAPSIFRGGLEAGDYGTSLGGVRSWGRGAKRPNQMTTSHVQKDEPDPAPTRVVDSRGSGLNRLHNGDGGFNLYRSGYSRSFGSSKDNALVIDDDFDDDELPDTFFASPDQRSKKTAEVSPLEIGS